MWAQPRVFLCVCVVYLSFFLAYNHEDWRNMTWWNVVRSNKNMSLSLCKCVWHRHTKLCVYALPDEQVHSDWVCSQDKQSSNLPAEMTSQHPFLLLSLSSPCCSSHFLKFIHLTLLLVFFSISLHPLGAHLHLAAPYHSIQFRVRSCFHLIWSIQFNSISADSSYLILQC